jgi:hypothetical protein
MEPEEAEAEEPDTGRVGTESLDGLEETAVAEVAELQERVICPERGRLAAESAAPELLSEVVVSGLALARDA